jgi:hypothetical protein
LTFTPDEVFNTDFQTEYKITLKGTGENVIRGLDGLVLDGDGDGQPGGDFITWFRLVK